MGVSAQGPGSEKQNEEMLRDRARKRMGQDREGHSGPGKEVGLRLGSHAELVKILSKRLR